MCMTGVCWLLVIHFVIFIIQSKGTSFHIQHATKKQLHLTAMRLQVLARCFVFLSVKCLSKSPPKRPWKKHLKNKGRHGSLCYILISPVHFTRGRYESHSVECHAICLTYSFKGEPKPQLEVFSTYPSILKDKRNINLIRQAVNQSEPLASSPTHVNAKVSEEGQSSQVVNERLIAQWILLHPHVIPEHLVNMTYPS